MAAKIPDSLRAVKPFLIIANQFESKNDADLLVVSYYVRLYAVQEGMRVARTDPAAKAYLIGVMDKLELMKRTLNEVGKGEEQKNDIVGQAAVESYALTLFDTADNLDRHSQFSKGLIKTFFTASQVFVSLKYFGELSEEIEEKMKYAKWKAVEIERCLKAGITPTPGPPGGFKDPDEPGALPTEPPPGNPGYQPGPSGGEPTGSYGNQPGPSQIGFDLPPVPYQTPPQPELPAEVKPVPKPRHDTHPTPPQPAASYQQPTLPPPAASYQQPTPPPPAASYQQPTPPQPAASYAAESSGPRGGGAANLGPAEITQAQKYCKYAASALDYDDIEGAIEYLTKASSLLKTGKEH